ncbi:hypothetical protein GPJ56_004737 [Histomonas meleagridis]|nr:hypothetical protein GPJ56_004737 [Histomonas meleagridis]
MKKIEIMIDDPMLQANKEPKITFEIQNNDLVYPCDPSIAVDCANLIFEGYSATRSMGCLKISIRDNRNILESIIDFIHGSPIIIDKTNAYIIRQLADALGIPLLSEHALRFINSNGSFTTDDEFDEFDVD